MHEFLVNHALENVWCNPRQDNQFVVAPKRISVRGGALNRITVMDTEVAFPIQRQKFHVFSVGQVDPWVLGLLRQVPLWLQQRWYSFAEAVNASNMEITIYNANGVVLPRNKTFYMFIDEQTLVFAVHEDKRFKVNFREEQIFFRFYTGAYFKNGQVAEKKLRCGAAIPTSNNDILALETLLQQKVVEFANVRVYVNGLWVDRVRLGDVNLGDYVEWVGDDSFVRMHEWSLKDLPKFRSGLDDTYKYVLHYPGVEPTQVEFQDDVDIHVVYRPDNGFARGLYYNRNYENHHRMLTHRDYAIRTDRVEVLLQELEKILETDISDLSKIHVQLFVRQDAYNRPLVFENQRIFEMYKLNDVDIVRSMVGLDSVVPEWNAVELEKCGYMSLMKETHRGVTIETTEAAYGYNACAKILADTPTMTYMNSGRRRAKISYGLQKNATFYEFDTNGLLLGWRNQINDNDYEAISNDCRMVEGVCGLGGDHVDGVDGQSDLPLPPVGTGYRVYRCYLVAGVPNNNWVDVTGSTEYEVVDNKLVWVAGGDDHWLHVRSDLRFITYDTEVEMNDGLLNFTIMENPTGNPMDKHIPMTIPMAQLDIYMNGRPLIKGLDFYVEFPQVFVTNRLYLNQPVEETKQRFHIRMRSLPASDMKLDAIEQRGWVMHNAISNNHRYDIKDDKVLQIIVGGRVMHRDQVLFGEDRPTPAPLAGMNGLPYQIKDLVVPMMGFTSTSTETMRASSQAIDQRVSDYMTEKYGPMEPTDLAAIPQRYPVVSPFLSHILFLLRNKDIVLPIERLMTNQEVKDICTPHENLLEFDPLADPTVDERFVLIVPHMNAEPYVLGFLEYRFFNHVVKLYTQGRVVTNEYVKLVTY